MVAHQPSVAGAVLIRAGEVQEGLATAAALGVSGAQDGADLLDPGAELRLLPARTPAPVARVRSGPRTGITGAGAVTPWRFWLAGEPSVSPHRPARP